MTSKPACPPHQFSPRKRGPDRCDRCKISYPDAFRGFGVGGFTTKKKKTRTLSSLSG